MTTPPRRLVFSTFVSVAFFASAGMPVPAQSGTDASAYGAGNSAVSVESTQSFFDDFMGHAGPVEIDVSPFGRSFKHRAANAAAKPWDSSKTVYFALTPAPDAGGVNAGRQILRRYDDATQQIMISSGSAADGNDGGWSPRNTRPLLLLQTTERAPYAPGSSPIPGVNVVVDAERQYVLYVHGTDHCPRTVFDPNTCTFTFPITKLLGQAMALAKSNLQILVGVRLRSYQDSFAGPTQDVPATSDYPIDHNDYRESIEADLVDARLVDQDTAQVLAEWPPAGTDGSAGSS